MSVYELAERMKQAVSHNSTTTVQVRIGYKLFEVVNLDFEIHDEMGDERLEHLELRLAERESDL